MRSDGETSGSAAAQGAACLDRINSGLAPPVP